MYIFEPLKAKNFSSNLYVQTSSEAHPASCAIGNGGPFPVVMRGRGVKLTAHPIWWSRKSTEQEPIYIIYSFLYSFFYLIRL
jgi:hypothetical protein